MCEYCGCRDVEQIGELMDEHSALMDDAHQIRRALGRGDQPLAMSRLTDLVGKLTRHVRREEAGVFTALRDKGEFLDELTELEAEHRQFDQTISALRTSAPDFIDVVTKLLDDLGEHVEREDLGIFPVSVVTLGAAGWETVDRARIESPSFLLDPTPPEVESELAVRPA
jgi:hemerythrin-like domain-containing protein